MPAVIARTLELGMAGAGFPYITAPRVGIYTNNFTPNADSVKADFTAATYTGYAVVTPTVSAVYVTNPGDQVAVDISPAVFNGPTAGAGVDAVGWYMYDNVTNEMYASGRFDSTLSLLNPLDRITVDSTLTLTGGAIQEVTH